MSLLTGEYRKSHYYVSGRCLKWHRYFKVTDQNKKGLQLSRTSHQIFSELRKQFGCQLIMIIRQRKKGRCQERILIISYSWQDNARTSPTVITIKHARTTQQASTWRRGKKLKSAPLFFPPMTGSLRCQFSSILTSPSFLVMGSRFIRIIMFNQG